jgi:predicted dehydrogenase
VRENDQMNAKSIGVGLVGVQPGRSWAAVAHIPALAALPANYHVVGVANTSLASAQKAVDAIGLGRSFETVQALIASPDVDLVTVTVKVSHHLEIVTAALEAGKAVYCEWPIGNGLAEARSMARLAQARGTPAFAGTQARVTPAMRYITDLVAQGYVGEVLSSTLVGNGGPWGPAVDQTSAYSVDQKNGATMLTVPFGHTMAAIVDALGPVESVSARLATRRTTVRVRETGDVIPMTAPDQVLVAATLESGALLSAHYRGGNPRGSGFLWEINGTKGDLQITAGSGHAQVANLSIKGATGDGEALGELTIPESYQFPQPLGAPANNVALIYQRIAADLTTGTHTAPTFADALKTHELIAAIERSAEEGRAIKLADVR